MTHVIKVIKPMGYNGDLMPRTFTTLTLDEVAEQLGWGPDEIAAELRDQRRAALRSDEALGIDPDPDLLAEIAEDKRLFPTE